MQPLDPSQDVRCQVTRKCMMCSNHDIRSCEAVWEASKTAIDLASKASGPLGAPGGLLRWFTGRGKSRGSAKSAITLKCAPPRPDDEDYSNAFAVWKRSAVCMGCGHKGNAMAFIEVVESGGEEVSVFDPAVWLLFKDFDFDAHRRLVAAGRTTAMAPWMAKIMQQIAESEYRPPA